MGAVILKPVVALEARSAGRREISGQATIPEPLGVRLHEALPFASVGAEQDLPPTKVRSACWVPEPAV